MVDVFLFFDFFINHKIKPGVRHIKRIMITFFYFYIRILMFS